ncbi:winged helix-turn-helix domain-containing protein [Bradyrhizobium sp. HKCCYLS1011]|uniref:winged helix-turn-helix domain-containing protein n=1 Tax=Bradyrhizobium sp. HKCCYLS1011 TaxID=3420733 RepID=UPI003EB87016
MSVHVDQSVPTVAAVRATGADTRIIIVDDDFTRRFEMVRYFESFDLNATSVSGWPELRRWLVRPGSHLVILDLEVARDSGLDLLREILSRFHVPVILIGGSVNDSDGIAGLETGADDYLARPLSLRELVARTRAILRRKQVNGAGASPNGIKPRGYAFNGWTLDRRSRILRDGTGDPVAVTKGEFALLLAFLEKPHQTLTRLDLMQAIRLNLDSTDRSIDVRIWRLRRKLQSYPGAPPAIETVRNLGYMFKAVVKPL